MRNSGQNTRPCVTCEGTGHVGEYDSLNRKLPLCPTCKGTGRKKIPREDSKQ